MTHIEQSLKENGKIIEVALTQMSLTSLQQIRSDMEAINFEQTRLQSLAKFVWLQDMIDITNMNVAMKLSEEAITSVTILKFYDNFMVRNGRVS